MASQSQLVKLETDVQLKASAEQFFDVFCNRTHYISKVCPEKVESVRIHEGEWGTQGSIISWNYVHDGKKCVAKQVIESTDKENFKMTFNTLDGDLLEQYKSFKHILRVTPQQKGSIAHWSLEYEKGKDDHIPDPHTKLQLVCDVSKDVDAHLITQPA